VIVINKFIGFILISIMFFLLSGCIIRETIKAPPKEFTVPKGSLVAECTKDEDTYKFVYQLDGVYLYYINDIEQGEEAINYLLEQAYLNGSSVENYLAKEYPGSCIFSNYVDDEN